MLILIIMELKQERKGKELKPNPKDHIKLSKHMLNRKNQKLNVVNDS